MFVQFYADLVAVAEECERRDIQPDIDITCVSLSERTDAEIEFTRAMVKDQLDTFKDYAAEDWPFPDGMTRASGGNAGRVMSPPSLSVPRR